jgi:ferredoxin
MVKSKFTKSSYAIAALNLIESAHAWSVSLGLTRWGVKTTLFMSTPFDDLNSNNWPQTEEILAQDDDYQDWEELLRQRENPDWSPFEPSYSSNFDDIQAAGFHETDLPDQSDVWLDTLQAVSIEELEFNQVENLRADSVRQMQEWGFSSEVIKNSLGVAVDDKQEEIDNRLMENFRNLTKTTGFGMVVVDTELDLKEVESHSLVDLDENGEPIRSQMVYVDEHTCIGCTNCATTAPSTFFMEDYLGRARVFQQWGDDDETIKIAIETCPVDCIHYVPYEELKSLEIQRRDQNINFKARLVNQGEYGGDYSHRVGVGSTKFTSAPKISGNLGARCNNCPTRGCANCPMYGVGNNPEFKRKEEARKKRNEERRRKQSLESASKSAEL